MILVRGDAKLAAELPVLFALGQFKPRGIFHIIDARTPVARNERYRAPFGRPINGGRRSPTLVVLAIGVGKRVEVASCDANRLSGVEGGSLRRSDVDPALYAVGHDDRSGAVTPLVIIVTLKIDGKVGRWLHQQGNPAAEIVLVGVTVIHVPIMSHHDPCDAQRCDVT